MTADTLKERLGRSPLADSVMDSVQFGAARVYCLPVAASTAGTVGEVEKEGKGGGTLTASGSPYNAFAVGTNVKHASTHQYGVRNRIIKAKNKKYLRFKVDGRWITRKKVKVTIPARPFLGLSAEDQTELQETVEDFIRRQGE